MNKRKILILEGGISNERQISLRSAGAVAKALKKVGYATEQYDTKKGLEGIFETEANLVFPILHGRGGEDGITQQLLEKNKMPFLGSGSDVSKLCFDKVRFKKRIRKDNILTPNWEVVEEGFLDNSEMIDNPFVLKPISGGSSIDTYIIREGSDINLIPKDIFARYPKMLMEELIIGTEITVAILDNKALPVVEIIPPENEEFDFENKYNGRTREICPAKSISAATQQRAQKLAEKVHKSVGARHLSRVDIMVTFDNVMYVLELNTIPGLTDRSLFPLAAETAGLKMPDLAKKFVNML